jgi:hypothetical protein
VVLINSYPGMLLSDSLEPDVSYSSILYCYYPYLEPKIIHLGRKESEEQLLEDKLAYFCNGFTMSWLTMFESLRIQCFSTIKWFATYTIPILFARSISGLRMKQRFLALLLIICGQHVCNNI